MDDQAPRPEEDLGAGGLVEEATAWVQDEEPVKDATPTGWLVWVYDHVAALVTGLLLIGVTYAVIARAFGVAVLGVIELGGWALVILTLMAAAGLVRRDGHVRVELLDHFLGEKAMKWAEVVSIILQIVITAVVLYAAVNLAVIDVTRDRTAAYGSEYFPRIYVSAFLPIGLGGVLIVLLVRLVSMFRRDPESEEGGA